MGIQSFSSKIGGQSFTIFAADNGILGQQTLIAFMQANGITFKPLVGSYQMETGEIVQECSFLVEENDFFQISKAGFVELQESILRLGPCNSSSKREALLCILKGEDEGDIIPLGLFQSVPEEEAKRDPDWTYDPSTNTYFICKYP